MRFWLSFIFLWMVQEVAGQMNSNTDNLLKEPDRIKAMAFLSSVDTMQQSPHWPHVSPKDFLANVRHNIEDPYTFSTGRGTSFCAYGAISFTCLINEPYRYTACMVALYQNGVANYRNVFFSPSTAIRSAAGRMRYQGDLDIHPADQIWFLTLADRFKGYVNFFNKRYNPGDENTMWASSNLRKFNRMLRRMCKYKIGCRGSDFIRPWMSDKYTFIKNKMTEGEVYLYINNTVFRKKNHNRTQLIVPTHFIVLNELYKKDNGDVVVKYWDGSYKTQKEASLRSFRKIIYGITWVKSNEAPEN